jgi:hypothetical protein
MSGPVDILHHSKPAMSPPVRPPAQQQQQQNQQSPQHIFNQLQVASNLGPADNATMRSLEKVTGVRVNSQFPNNMSNAMADPHFQVGSLANYWARSQNHQYPPQRANLWRSPYNMMNIDPQAARIAQAHQNPCKHENAPRSPQNRIIIGPQSSHNAHALALHPIQNYRAPTQAHPQTRVQPMQNPQHPQGQTGPLPPDLAQIQSLLLSQGPVNRGLTQMVVDQNRGTGFPLPPALNLTGNEWHSRHDGRGNNVMENRIEEDERYGYIPTLQGFQHQDTHNWCSPNQNGTPNGNGGEQLLRLSFSPHTRHQNSHHLTNNNQACRPALTPRQPTQASLGNPRVSSPHQYIQASPLRPLHTLANVNEDYGHQQCTLHLSSCATGQTPTRSPTPKSISHRSPLASAQNHGTELKRMLNTIASQYVEGPPNKRPCSISPISAGPSIGHFASPVILRPASVAANSTVCLSSEAVSRRDLQPIISSSPCAYVIDRHISKDDPSGKRWTSGLFPGHNTAMKIYDFPMSPEALKTTREHINDDEGLGCYKPDEETGDSFAGLGEEPRYVCPDDLYKYLGHRLLSKAKQRTEPDALGTHHKAESKLELNMLAKRFGVRLSKVDTGQGGVHLAVGNNVWLAPGRKLKVAHYPLPKDPEEAFDAEMGNEDARRMVVDLTDSDVAPLVFHSTLTNHMVAFLKLTARRPLPEADLSRCTAEEEGVLRAPDPESPTEQHADLMWLLKPYVEEKDMHSQPENDESGLSWIVEDTNE